MTCHQSLTLLQELISVRANSERKAPSGDFPGWCDALAEVMRKLMIQTNTHCQCDEEEVTVTITVLRHERQPLFRVADMRRLPWLADMLS